MEKDLRDAYAALKLLRADLVKTRRDKQMLEASLSRYESHGLSRSAALLRESRKSQLMQQEDATSQLWRLGRHYENKLLQRTKTQVDNNCQKKAKTALNHDNQPPAQKDPVESVVLIVEEPRPTILTQDVVFLQPIKEFKKETQQLLQTEKNKVVDAVEEKEKESVKWQKRLELQEEEKKLLKVDVNCERMKKVREENERRERYERTLQELEQKCAELTIHVADIEFERTADVKKHEEAFKQAEEQHTTTVHSLEMKLVEVHQQLAISKTSRLAETQEYEKKLAATLKTLQEQQEDRDQHVVTIRKLRRELKVAQTQRETSDAELAKEVKNNQERRNGLLQQLRDQRQHEEQNAMIVRDLESKLSETQLQFGNMETNRLAQLNEYEEKLMKTLKLAAQHEDTARMLALEKKALQQEVLEARHALKLMTEKLQTFQLVSEEKTQEHMRCMNQVQVQCESLETQLLSAEDQRMTKSGHSSSTLETFHGRTDDEITAMSPWRSWDLLRSGIKEIDGFLPRLQASLNAMNDALQLCEAHADALPVLCERLEREAASEKEQLPILSTALHLLRFAGMLKARTQQEEISVTADFVQSFRKRVLNALAQWYECDAGDNDQGESKPMPTPTFTTTSRETALILQNWTDDRTKQLGVRRWLARMEAYPGVPPLRGASSNRVLELPPEGCTLELDDMTSEVKDAFLLLVIPILKQNRALHVRVFIRYTCNNEAMLKQHQDDEEEKVWNMRIHVQSTVTRPRPPDLKLSPSSRGSPSPLAPTSPASSVSSISSTASSRLQIIQERLQYLHHNA